VPAAVCVVLSVTVPTVAPVSPFTPVIDVIAAEWDRPSYVHAVRRHHDHRVRLVDRKALVYVW
jgi:hypothetical protein